MATSSNPYGGFRFSAEVIEHVVWLGGRLMDVTGAALAGSYRTIPGHPCDERLLGRPIRVI